MSLTAFRSFLPRLATNYDVIIFGETNHDLEDVQHWMKNPELLEILFKNGFRAMAMEVDARWQENANELFAGRLPAKEFKADILTSNQAAKAAGRYYVSNDYLAPDLDIAIALVTAGILPVFNDFAASAPKMQRDDYIRSRSSVAGNTEAFNHLINQVNQAGLISGKIGAFWGACHGPALQLLCRQEGLAAVLVNLFANREELAASLAVFSQDIDELFAGFSQPEGYADLYTAHINVLVDSGVITDLRQGARQFSHRPAAFASAGQFSLA
jgi:hypothetical protein